MKRTCLTALACAAMLCACAKDGGHSAAAAPDSGASTAAPEAPAPAAPTGIGGIGGAPDYARRGVDSANAAQQRQLDQVNGLSDQASGTRQP